ncbi:MAG: hypothetical protein HY842_05825 [Bacteroidetes bacterium]|nr:hypothetical protein [Bacteroidota bacterium]
MNRRRFFFQLALLTLGTGAVLFFLQIFAPFQPFKDFSSVGLLFFALLSVAMYFPAAKAAFSPDKNAFTRLVMLFTFGKMFLTTALIVGYHRIFKPESNLFLIPFFFTYLVFTIFETMYMSKLGKIKAR